MSEVHIRINKRFFERTIWVLLLVAIVLFFVLSQEPQVDTEQLTTLQQEINNLTAQNEQLTTQLASLEAELEQAQTELEQAQQEPEPQEQAPEPEEPELSGVLDISYDAQVSDGRLEAFIIAVNNGLGSNQELTAQVNWVGGDLSQVVQYGEVFVRSGRNGQIIIDSLPSNPGEDVDTIRVLVRDADENVVDQDNVRVL